MGFGEDSKKTMEFAQTMQSVKLANCTSGGALCHGLPQMTSKDFFGREDVLNTLEENLIGDRQPESRSVLLHGIGGVGKTRVALQFANTYRNVFDAVLWVSAGDKFKVERSYYGIARQLGLTSKDEKADDASLMISKVRDWLSNPNFQWLIVLDNVKYPDILTYAWPGTASGSILVTARDKTIAFGTSILTCHVQPFDNALASSSLLILTGRLSPSEEESDAAKKIVEALGGLPLAINQIGGFITRQRMRLPDFVPLYEKYSSTIDQRGLGNTTHEHTISTLWEAVLNSLPGPSTDLLSLLAFFDADSISESVLMDGCTFGYSQNEMYFLDAKEPLLRNALIERDSLGASLSVHRLVQGVVMNRLSDDEKTELLDRAVIILSHGFPNTWNSVAVHQFGSWTQCNLRVAHASALLSKSRKYNVKVGQPRKFAELIFRFAWYSYERELYDQAENLLDGGMKILGEINTLMYASACTLRGLIQLDTMRVTEALQSFLAGLHIREKLLFPDNELIASSLNAISLSYTELNQLGKAVKYGMKAINIRLFSQSGKIGNSYSNMASTLLRMDKPDEAEQVLGRCPSLKDLTDDVFLKSGNPRFAGDMVLLSRIRSKQGRVEDALRLASKALDFRREMHGNCLKTCDSLQLVASLQKLRGRTDSAVSFYKESAAIAETLPYGECYSARAYYQLAQLYATLHDDHQSQTYMRAAEEARLKVRPTNVQNLDHEENEKNYEGLVPWMLW